MKTLPFHGPLRQYRVVPFQRKTSGIFSGSRLIEKLPIDGSEGLFQDVSTCFSFVLKLVLSFIFAMSVSHVVWKLSQAVV